MSDENKKPVLVEMLETLIQADLIRAIENMPHLSRAERQIAVGRALRRGVVDDLVEEMITEEIKLAELQGGEVSDDLAEAVLATMPMTYSA